MGEKSTKHIVSEVFEKSNIKQTLSREKVLSILIESRKPLCVQDIRNLSGGELDRVSIYRNLECFLSRGIIYRSDFRKGRAFFEYQTNHHHHITCTICGDRESIDFCISDKLDKIKSSLKKFNSPSNHILEFFGKCKKCENK
ncbi:transcriptional repressor [Candidatus Nomurabacteria bacterium]|nr:transcriptional repressor [Candidatus Nomurabacteria bacterium]USN94639.1 MAG: transcriptional repressor [Candidatus Nomurabacteria bacterium]